MWKRAASQKAGRQRKYCSQIQYCLLVLLVPMMIFLLGAGALTTQAYTNSSQFRNLQTLTVPLQETYAPGETFKIGNLQYRVNNVRILDNGKSPGDGDTFLLINLTIENRGSSDIEVRSMIGFKLTDQNGKRQESSLEALLTVNDAIDGTIKAGGRMEGELGYKVFNEPQTFVFSVIPDPLSSKARIANVCFSIQ